MKNPKDWVILPELISREFLGAYTRQGDERWTILVNWVHYAMLEAEVLGITKANVDKIKAETKDPETRGLLGLEGTFGKQLGVDNALGYNTITAPATSANNSTTYSTPLH